MKQLTALLLALALCLSLSAPALAAGTGFSDVPAGHWAYDAIHYVAGKGIASGYADGTFRPTGILTNAQFAVMLSRAFYPEEAGALKLQTEKRAWYWANLKALHNHHILKGTALASEPNWAAAAGQDVSRYDVAQMLYNILTDRGWTTTLDQRAGARVQIADWDSIHSAYRMAVSTCYALDLLTGLSDGTFGGASAMKRGQGCVVVTRLLNRLALPAPWPEEPEESVKPTTVAVSHVSTPTETGSTTGWSVGGNDYPDGILNNGKRITEANVSAMLQDAREIWYDGMPWGGIVKGDNNYYDVYAHDSVLTFGGQLVVDRGGTPTTNAGGFAAMLSDYVFGLHSNPARKLEDSTKIRPGDLIFQMTNGKLTHVRVALSTVQYQDGVPYAATCDGNLGSQVSWDTIGEETSGRLGSYGQTDGVYITCAVYTRYPE